MDKYIIANQSFVVDFIGEKSAFSGVKKIADKVIDDVYKVSGKKANHRVCELDGLMKSPLSSCVIYGTIGKSDIISDLEARGIIDLSNVTGKREVFGFFFVEKPFEGIEWSLVIAGSDKRGTIYGLFHISELLNVSPYTNWSNVLPAKKEELSFGRDKNFVSKEPSVEFRGFFINDEWPAFGTWCNKRFGGFNAEMYDNIFEVLLRLKGNYMWPAMWSACFAEDGPGLANAELADEYGVVMGLSHHEPCLRHGEEYSHVRGKDSIYGDAWNFHANPEGIRRFWRDGLKRNGHLENVITIGMRGERDSAIMGDDATLEDNINLLRDVIANQHALIREEVNDNLEEVPRLLALYKEVEPYFYGDVNTKGLMEDEALKDVIFLLCDDNHGYLRSRPFGKMLEHKGGYGMYYHFDYHGDPISYEWVNSSYLPVVWEQMTQAYETGIQKLWIVNVGDFAFQEFPLNYFMDLAYDYDKYGVNHPNETRDYTMQWVKKQFASVFTVEQLDMLENVMTEYCHITHNRRPEHLNDKIYHVSKNMEAKVMLERAKSVMEQCQQLMDACSEEQMPAFYELVYYNVMASMNLLCMWIYRSFNHFFAGKSAIVANDFGQKMLACMKRDEELKNEFHGLLDGKWDGFAEARHIGFENWNFEESHNPVLETVFPIGDPRLVVGVCGTDKTTSGEEWTKKKLFLKDFTEYGNKKAAIYIATACDSDIEYTVSCDDSWVVLSKSNGVLNEKDSLDIISVSYDENQVKDAKDTTIHVKYSGIADAEIIVKAPKVKPSNITATNVFVECNGVVCMEANHFTAKGTSDKGSFVELVDLARAGSAMKTFPIHQDFEVEDALWLGYDFWVENEGEYRLIFELEPANPGKFGNGISLVYDLNDTGTKEVNELVEGYTPGVSKQWEEEVKNHVRIIEQTVKCNQGKNNIRFYATKNENVLERIMLFRKDVETDQSYLGPKESMLFK
ncbi:MAG: glycosyl hydrolase 115 family protein [Eubacteriales bacterium]|nr:glycosyl hydrolase 115 family protein [Eubacteriales bacterium]